MIDSKDFIQNLVEEVRSALVDPEKVVIKAQADSAVLAPTVATTLGALLLESINNALKHAFPDGMPGILLVRFTVSDKQYVIELEDDGVGIERAQSDIGFGIQNLTDIIHLMKGSVTHHPAGQSKTRPGTVWRLAIPA
jgi:two-component sensor histidine kinase